MIRGQGWRRLVVTRWATALALGVIVLLGFVLRVQDIDWDAGQHLHPDERFQAIVTSQIAFPASPWEYFDSASSPLNPYNANRSFVYGTAPLFLNKLAATWLSGDAAGAPQLRSAATALGVPFNQSNGMRAIDDGYNSQLVGRLLGALADSLTIVVVFLITRRLAGRGTALLAAAAWASTVLAIQYAHFFGAEPFVVLLTSGVLYASIRLAQGGGWWWYPIAGLLSGLAVASKLNAAAVLVLPAAGAALGAAMRWQVLTDRQRSRAALVAAVGVVAAGVVTALTFRVAQPYAFAGPGVLDGLVRVPQTGLMDPLNWFGLSEGFRRDLRELLALQNNAIDFPPGLQWVNRWTTGFWAVNLAAWGLGWGLTIGAAVGAVVAAVRIWRGQWALVLVIGWAVLSLWFAGRGAVVTMRYFLPAYPALVILAALGIAALWSGGPSLAAWWQRRGWSAVRLDAGLARWLTRGMAVALVALAAGWTLAFSAIYWQDHSRIQASRWIAGNVPVGSAITNVEWDDGLPLPLPGVPFSQYRSVQLKPFIPDGPDKRRAMLDGLDEAQYIVESSNRAFGTIPRVPERYPDTARYYAALFDGSLGFERVAEFTNPPRLGPLAIDDQGAEEAFTVYDHPRVIVWRKTAGYSRATAEAILTSGRIPVPFDELGKNSLLSAESAARQQAGGSFDAVFSDGILSTWLAPLTWWLVALVAGFVALPWLRAVLPRAPDLAIAVAKPLGVLVIAWAGWWLASLGWLPFDRWTLLGVAVLLAGASAVAWRRSSWRDWSWRRWLGWEAAFIAAYGLFLVVRAANPDLWHPYRGGEKPMDLSIIQAVARSTSFPPYDAWFAGGSLNYYYLGQYLLAALMRVTGTPVEIAVNVGVALWWGWLVIVAGASSMLLATRLGLARTWRAGPLVAACGGAFFVALAGNLDGWTQLAEGYQAASGRTFAAVPLVGGGLDMAAGVWATLTGGTAGPAFDFWRSSRVMAPTPNITEFPFWTFLFADPHAHLFALPFTVVVIGLGIGRTMARGPVAVVGLAVLAALVTGWLRGANTWDFPTMLAIYAGCVVVARWLEPGLAPLRRAAAGLGEIAGVALGGWLLWAPFHLSYRLFYDDILPAPDRATLAQYLQVHGIALFFAGSLLAWLAWRSVRRSGQWPVLAVFVGMGLVAAGLSLAGRLPPVAGFTGVLLLVAAWLGVDGLQRRLPGQALVAVLAGVAAGTAMVIEFVTVEGDIGRMNTVFRFYLQAWTAWALLAGAGLAGGTAVLARLVARRSWAAPVRLAWLGAALGFILLALLFPLIGTQSRLQDRFVTRLPLSLDGFDYMAGAVYQDEKGPIRLADERALTDWLRANVEGSPVVLEGLTPTYRWGNRVAVLTGLPSVVGWDWHQRQQRWGTQGQVVQRLDDVDRAYRSTSPDDLRRVLSRYGVEYVVVGQVERLYYPPAGLAKFATMPDVRRVYDDGVSQVYRVER